ncbi:Na+ driven multidrug efflux pump [Spironucleus salmonicida]|uniref:Na+ driven multidrug efflux pump n=1 Tax=Spironucleus salmonicida TaxID=348837 RepID=V6LTB5_9EUKA|nr:Na+ driven multidrug efflux pump [Spironucleus salmonicida]|eukprot:EST46936.1 Na+ driven multidrug efflux pump [Spironucleus salmonicida]
MSSTYPTNELTAEDITLGSKSPLRTIASLASRQLISYLISALYLFVIPILVTRTQPNAEAQLAAVAIAGPFEYLAFMFGWFFAVGGSACIGNCIGKGEIEHAEALVMQMLLLGTICGVLIAVCLVPCLRQILGILVDEHNGVEVIGLAYDFILPQLAGSILIIWYNVLLAIFMGTGQMSFYLYMQIGQQVLNLAIMCPCFLFLTDMGIFGPGLANIISYVPSLLISLILIQKTCVVKIRPRLILKKWKIELLKNCCKIGIIDLISSASGMIVLGTVQVLITKIANRYADETPDIDQKKAVYEQVLAAWGTLSTVYNVTAGVCYNSTGSYLTAAAYARGAGRKTRFVQLSIVIVFYVCLLNFTFLCAVAAFANYLALVFSSNELYVKTASDIIRIFCASGIILPLQYLSTTYCQAADLFWQGFVVAIVTQILLIPVLFVILCYSSDGLSPKANFYVSMSSFNINDVISGIISVGIIYYYLKKYCRQNSIKLTWKIAFGKTDTVDDQPLENTESEYNLSEIQLVM